jgi:hypothetical protein
MHYRVSFYNFFHDRFAGHGWEWQVLTNRIQPQNQIAGYFHLRLAHAPGLRIPSNSP